MYDDLEAELDKAEAKRVAAGSKHVSTALDEWLVARREAAGDRPTAAGTMFRGSKAYSCTRAVGLDALGVQATPPDAHSLLTFDIGQRVHDLTQAAVVEKYGAQTEVMVDWTPLGVSFSGHADGAKFDPDGEGEVVLEVKSTGSFGFRTMPGPKPAHLTQAGMYATSPQLDCERVLMVYVDRDSLRLKEYLLNITEELPHIPDTTVLDLVGEEVQRLERIAARVNAGEVPGRYVPGHGLVQNPKAKDAPWACRYCGHRATCAGLPTGPTPLTVRSAA